MDKPKRYNQGIWINEDRGQVYLADEMDAYIEYIREGKESQCVHCDALLDAENDTEHWRECKKHPAHAFIADLAKEALIYIQHKEKVNTPYLLKRASFIRKLERLAEKGGE